MIPMLVDCRVGFVCFVVNAVKSPVCRRVDIHIIIHNVSTFVCLRVSLKMAWLDYKPSRSAFGNLLRRSLKEGKCSKSESGRCSNWRRQTRLPPEESSPITKKSASWGRDPRGKSWWVGVCDSVWHCDSGVASKSVSARMHACKLVSV